MRALMAFNQTNARGHAALRGPSARLKVGLVFLVLSCRRQRLALDMNAPKSACSHTSDTTRTRVIAVNS